MAGNQSRGLRIASLTRGWDCTKIEGGKPGEDSILPNYDKDPWPKNIAFSGDGLGKFPGGAPDSFSEATDPAYSQKVTFNTPDTSRETKNRATSGADPTPQMPGA